MHLNSENILQNGTEFLKKAEKYKSVPSKVFGRFKRLKTAHWIVILLLLAGTGFGLYFLLKPGPEPVRLPIVNAQPVEVKDMEIYGEYEFTGPAWKKPKHP